LFFHLLDLAVLSRYILHYSCGCKKISHRDFRYTLVRNMLAHAGPERSVPRPLGRPPNVESHIAMLEVCERKNWPTRSETQLRCRVCKARGVTKKVFVKCRKCDMGLCVKQTCFKEYHTKAQRTSGTTSLRKIWTSRRYVSKWNWKFSIFHIITMYNYEPKILTGFLNTRTIISVVSQKMPFNSLFNLVLFPNY